MLKTQEAKLNMYNAVISYSDASAAITATIAAYGTTLTALKAKQAAITTTAQLESQVISGITINKADLKKSLCTSGSTVAAGLYAYASSINDPILKEKANYTYSDLFKMKDDELGPVAQNIHNDSNAVIATLPPFGVTAAILTSLQSIKDDYTNGVSAPRNAVAQRKSYKAQLKTLFKETDTLLKTQLDKIALQFKAAQPDFYMTYKNNRIIIDAGVSNSQAAGTITDSATTNPINGVIITANGQTYTATSNPEGTYSLKIPDPGTYTIIFTKTGYQTHQQTNVIITLGQTTPLDVELVPLS